MATSAHSFPDSLLLEVFKFYRLEKDPESRPSERYRKLRRFPNSEGYDFHDPEARHSGLHQWFELVPAHVCRRWRQIILAHPKYLDLRVVLCDTSEHLRPHSAAEILRHSPLFPIKAVYTKASSPPSFRNDMISMLGHLNRVRDLRLLLGVKILGTFLSKTKGSTPELEKLELSCLDLRSPLILPVTFFLSNTPRLCTLKLSYVDIPVFISSNVVELTFRVYSGKRDWLEKFVLALCSLSRLEILRLDSPSQVSNSSAYNRPWSLAKLRQLEFTGHGSYLEAALGSVNAPLLSHLVVEFGHTGVPVIQRLTDHMLQHSTTAAYVGVQSSSVIIRGCPMDPCTGRERMLFQAKFTFDTVASFERLLPVMQLIFSRIETLILGVDVGVRFPSSSFQAIGVYDARLWCALLTKAAFNAATCVRMDSYVMPSVLWALQISEDFRFPPNMHEVRLDLSARFIERPASAWVELFRNYFHPSVDISHNLYTKENWAYRHSDCGAPTTQQ